MLAQKSTIKQSFIRLVGGFEIQPYHLGVVMKGENHFGRFLQPGEYPPLNPLNEYLAGQFPVVQRTLQATGEMASADGYTVTATIRVQYIFDPSRADARHQGEIIGIISNRHADSALREKLRPVVLYELRNQIQRYQGAELMGGQVYRLLEQGVQRLLLRSFNGLGFLFEGTGSVYIEALEPSLELIRDIRRQRMAQLLEKHPQTGPQVLWLDTLAQQNSVIYHADNAFMNQAALTETAVTEQSAHATNNGDGRRSTNVHPYIPKAC